MDDVYEQAKRTAVEALKRINPAKAYGTELFDGLCRLTVTVAVEVVCLRRNAVTDEVEVLLTKRRDDDTAHPGEWHCPGSYKRPGELDDEVFARLEQREFRVPILRRQFIGHYDNPAYVLGHLLHLVYLCEVQEGGTGTWYSVDCLPERTAEPHRDHVIPMVARAFLSGEGN